MVLLAIVLLVIVFTCGFVGVDSVVCVDYFVYFGFMITKTLFVALFMLFDLVCICFVSFCELFDCLMMLDFYYFGFVICFLFTDCLFALYFDLICFVFVCCYLLG